LARYTGPSCKICRRNRVKLFLKGDRCHTAKCAIEKRNFPPGPKAIIPRKLSEYGRRLREKQKLRFHYGVSEKQIRGYFSRALRQKGVTGYNLLGLFESRLDNVVFRAKLAASRAEARQSVRHGHFLLNGKKANIPSILVKAGDILHVAVSDAVWAAKFEKTKEKGLPTWLSFGSMPGQIQVLQLPAREEIDAPVEEQLIVEFYSR
jgi:small subunit ribosomal protein S4